MASPATTDQAQFAADYPAPDQPPTIDALLKELCVKHGLTSMSLGYHRYSNCSDGFAGYAHWEQSGGQCASGSGKTASDALSATLADMMAIRNRIDVAATIAAPAAPVLA